MTATDRQAPCTHPLHDVPPRLNMAPGDIYEHQCPGCGHKIVCYGTGTF